MAQFKKFFEKIILLIITISILLTFCAMPSSYAKLDLEEGEFYYAGTQKGQYTVSEGIFEWLLSKIGEIADWILGIITMGFRMVFVGWTALLEKLLTWGLESVAGVSNSGDIVESNTDLTAITDSSNNVTMEAIVYNHVPGLNANVFDYEIGKEELKYSGTGQILKCKKCKNEDGTYKTVEECCGEDGSCCEECGGKCDGCKAYKEALDRYNNADTEPIITQIKKTVALWYYIIRTLAIAAMLVVLIAVGIKMVVSTIASDKALYKRMLFDWLVGMIILFSMHYIMLFIFYVNEELVSTIEETSDAITEVQMRQLAVEGSQEGVQYTNSEIELKVYEAIRTRAYDAKLINGLTGMIMYMTLVFFAFKYTIIYIKRFFTIIVLTIMAPGVGVGYAIQKVMTGKQDAFKNWLTEYVLNVIIQTVHALIYSIFISQALVLSLESISGIIFALILMNYTSKADKLFRKIFRISTGGGLVDDTDNAMESLQDTVQSAVIGGKSAAKTLTNTPYANAAKGLAKAAVALPFLGGYAATKAVRALRDSGSSDENEESIDSNVTEETSNNPSLNSPNGQQGEVNPENGSGGTGENGENKDNGNKSSSQNKNTPVLNKSDDELLATGKKTLEKNLENAKKAIDDAETPEDKKKAVTKYLEAKSDYNRYIALTDVSNREILTAHVANLFDGDTHFGMSRNSSWISNIKALKNGVFGKTYIDRKTGKKVNDGTGFYNQLRPTNLFGLTSDDKKLLKENWTLGKNTILGMGGMLLGMGMIVANPTYGMGLLTLGAHSTYKGLSRPKTIDRYKGKYTFSRFGLPAIKNMSDIAIARSREENSAYLRARLKKEHPRFYAAIKLGTAPVATLAATIGTGSIVPVVALGAGMMAKRFVATTNIGNGINTMNTHYLKQQKQQEKQFKIDTLNTMKIEAQARMETLLNEENSEMSNSEKTNDYKKELFDKLGYDFDPVTGNIMKKGNTSKAFKEKEEFENALDSKMKNNVVEDFVIPEGLIITPEQLKQEKSGKKAEVTEDLSDGAKKLTADEKEYIDKKIDEILVEHSKGNILDLSSEKTIASAKDELNKQLTDAGILDKDNVLSEEKVKEVLVKKGIITNQKIVVASQALKSMSGRDQELIKKAVATIKEQKGASNYTTLDATEVIKVFENNKKAQSSKKVQPLTDKQKQQLSKDIEKFLSGLELAKTVTHDSAYKKKRAAKHEVEGKTKRRKRKLEQVLEMTYDTEIDDPTDNIINQVEKIKDEGGYITDSKGKLLEITADEANKTLEMLFFRKELEELNNVAVEELELDKGSYQYAKNKKAESEATIDYYTDLLKVRKYERENPEIYNDKNYKTKRNVYSQDQINERSEIEEIEKQLVEKKRKIDVARRETIMSGPIVDLNETKKILLNQK